MKYLSKLKPILQSKLQGYLQTSTFISIPGAPSNKREFKERRLMGYSRDQMYKVVSDIEHYKDFLPWCTSSTIKTKTANLISADLTIGMKPVTEQYTSKVTLIHPYLIKAESTNGRHFNRMITQWKFHPGLKSLPNSCIVDFYVSLEFKSVLHSQIANVFFNEVVRAMAGAFFNEAKRRFGEESISSRRIEILGKNERE